MAQPTASSSASERRQSVRTGVAWEGVRRLLESGAATDGRRARIVDIGGGTGGFAVPLAELGHHVRVIDPSPDALAALDRRARESGVADRVTGQQGDLGDLAGLVEAGSVDLVLCHGVLEVVDDPAADVDDPGPRGEVGVGSLQHLADRCPHHAGADGLAALAG